MKKIFISLAALAILASCTPHTTGATQVGVRFNKITRTTEIADPGATYFFAPIINDWTTYDTSTQNLIMSAKAAEGDRTEKGDRKEKDVLRFKTRDGNDIETDVIVRWRIDPTKAAYLWKAVAPNTNALKERLIRPDARAYVRDVLNRLDSE